MTPDNSQLGDKSSKGKGDLFADSLLQSLEQQPALYSAFQAQAFSADVGFDFANIDLVVGKVKEEHAEVLEAFDRRDADFAHYAEEIGDCFFALVNLCRHSGVDPEGLLKENVRKYLLRCKYIEDQLRQEQKNWADIPLDEIYRRWKEAKKLGL